MHLMFAYQDNNNEANQQENQDHRIDDGQPMDLENIIQMNNQINYKINPIS